MSAQSMAKSRAFASSPEHGASPRVLYVIPAKDEGENLPTLLPEIEKVQALRDVLIIDDGSSDDTAKIGRSFGCHVLSHPYNLGYGTSLQTGYRWALRHGYDIVVQLDADGQHRPSEVAKILEPITAGRADVVIGSRYREPGSYKGDFLRRIASRGMAKVASIWMGQKMTDPTSGFQALSGEALRLICHGGFPDDFPDVDVLITMHRSGLRLEEVSAHMRARTHGTSMHGGLRVIYYFYRLFVCLALLPIRRHSPYRNERRDFASRVGKTSGHRNLRLSDSGRSDSGRGDSGRGDSA